jgi:cell division septum initiation protein DivIVA
VTITPSLRNKAKQALPKGQEKQTGKSKSTLVRAIKSGKLSAERNENGDYRVEPSELFRVYKSVVHHDEPVGAPEAQSAVVADLLEMMKTRDSENASLRGDLDDTRERLQEHREAARSLMSPDQFSQQLKTAVDAERQKAERQNEEFLKQISQRKSEVEQARNEAVQLADNLQREADKRSEAESLAKALESRGLISRIFNRKPTIAG